MVSAAGYSHIFALLVLVLVTLHSDASQAASAPLNRRDDLTTEVFSPSDMCRIWASTSVLINSTMWVDGGGVTIQVCNTATGGQSSNCTTWDDINNYVFAISFEKSFSSAGWSSLSYKAIRKPKSVPLTRRGVLWRNKLGTELYKFGGGISVNETSVNFNSTTDVAQIWSYATGSNTWTDISPALSDSLDLQYCSVPSLDKSFAFGTWGGTSGVSKSSMMTLDTANSVSARLLDASNAPAEGYLKGAMLHLPVQGGEGVLLFIGGSVIDGPNVPMDSVHLYDIKSNAWFNQSTSTDTSTGAFPNPRHNFCASLVSTGSKSFDIFMYGGDFNVIEDTSFSSGLWILSIPSFRWFYFSDPDTRARLSGSACQVIGSHFIRFGGWNSFNPSPMSGSTCLNSISIFDLNSFTWTDSFDPAAAAYISPAKVTAWNTKTQAPVGGWDSGVQALFAGLNETSTTTSNSPDSSSTTASAAAKSTSKKLPGILGGILGGLAGTALVLSGILFLLKRKKEQAEFEGQVKLENQSELAGEAMYAEMPSKPDRPVAELPADGSIVFSTPLISVKRNDSPDVQV